MRQLSIFLLALWILASCKKEESFTKEASPAYVMSEKSGELTFGNFRLNYEANTVSEDQTINLQKESTCYDKHRNGEVFLFEKCAFTITSEGQWNKPVNFSYTAPLGDYRVLEDTSWIDRKYTYERDSLALFAVVGEELIFQDFLTYSEEKLALILNGAINQPGTYVIGVRIKDIQFPGGSITIDAVSATEHIHYEKERFSIIGDSESKTSWDENTLSIIPVMFSDQDKFSMSFSGWGNNGDSTKVNVDFYKERDALSGYESSFDGLPTNIEIINLPFENSSLTLVSGTEPIHYEINQIDELGQFIEGKLVVLGAPLDASQIYEITITFKMRRTE